MNEEMSSDPLNWMLEAAKARNCDPRARTVNLKFSKATLDMWQEAAENSYDWRAEHVPPAVRMALMVLLNHIGPGWENCAAVVQLWLDRKLESDGGEIGRQVAP